MVSTRGTIGAPRRRKLFLCAALFAAGFMTPVHAIDYPQDQKKTLSATSLDDLTDDFLAVALNWQGQLIKFDEPRKLGVRIEAGNKSKEFWKEKFGTPDVEQWVHSLVIRFSEDVTEETGLIFQEVTDGDRYLDLDISMTPRTLRFSFLHRNPALYEFQGDGAITVDRHRYSRLTYGLPRPCGNIHHGTCYECGERVRGEEQGRQIATTRFAKECSARPNGFIRVDVQSKKPIDVQCIPMVDVEAGLISFQVADCLLRAAGLTGESPLFPSAVVGEHLPKQQNYFIGEGESISRPDYVARMPAELTMVDRLYLSTLYDPRLKSGQTRQEARPIVRRILAEKLVAMRPR